MKTGMDRRYTVEFRVQAVRQVEVGDRTMSQVARSLEMSVKTLANWVYKSRKGQTLVSHLGAGALPVTDAQAELSRLKQENARLRLEKEILKKAAAYFARELV